MDDAARDTKDAEQAPPPVAASEPRGWWAGAPLSARAHLLLGLVLPALLLIGLMWWLRTLTVDDAYISFRYARNLARGWGLVYNEGERIEGYTNFLLTVVLAGGIRVGLDPVSFAKAIGAASALAALYFTYRIAELVRPLSRLPCVATWLFASSAVLAGYAVFGLETLPFAALILGGTLRFLQEDDARAAFQLEAFPAGRSPHRPWSAAIFAAAALTRPEAPLYLGLLSLYLGRRFLGRQSLTRLCLFAAPVAVHLLWRHAYYGSWLPNTLMAKTGSFDQQYSQGRTYIESWARFVGPTLFLAGYALLHALVRRSRLALALATVACLATLYVWSVGGDWMPYFRFLAPVEPFVFLLVDLGAREAGDRPALSARLGLLTFLVAAGFHRSAGIGDAQRAFAGEETFWRSASGGVVDWLAKHDKPGGIALGDIGYVGYATDYPLLDLLGLVDPVISKLPGGYTRKVGPGFADRFFDVAPRYMIMIAGNARCNEPTVPSSQAVYRDPRFTKLYEVGGKVPLGKGAWCIYERKDGGR